MILGHIHIDENNGAVSTHRDSYLLDSITVASVRRPFFIGGLGCGAGSASFAVGFADLLYTHEITLALAIAVTACIGGFQVGQLKLLSRDLRGSDLSDVIWGRYASLNAVRMRIADAMASSRKGARP